MYKIKVILDTQGDIAEFVNIASTIKEDVYLEDGANYRANAKSLLGVMYGMTEFKELHVLSEDSSIANKFSRFRA